MSYIAYNNEEAISWLKSRVSKLEKEIEEIKTALNGDST